MLYKFFVFRKCAKYCWDPEPYLLISHFWGTFFACVDLDPQSGYESTGPIESGSVDPIESGSVDPIESGSDPDPKHCL